MGRASGTERPECGAFIGISSESCAPAMLAPSRPDWRGGCVRCRADSGALFPTFPDKPPTAVQIRDPRAGAAPAGEIGRAAWRDGGCPYILITGGAVSVIKNQQINTQGQPQAY